MTAVATQPAPNALAAGKLPRWAPWAGVAVAQAVSFAIFGVMHLGTLAADPAAEFPVAGAIVVANSITPKRSRARPAGPSL